MDTILDLVLEDRSRIPSVFFSIDERNIARQLREPWVSLGSDGASMAPEGIFLEGSTHPRAYGNVARLLGKYVRKDHVLTLAEAVRRLSRLPATDLGLDKPGGRGFLAEGMYADVVVFDPKTVPTGRLSATVNPTAFTRTTSPPGPSAQAMPATSLESTA